MKNNYMKKFTLLLLALTMAWGLNHATAQSAERMDVPADSTVTDGSVSEDAAVYLANGTLVYGNYKYTVSNSQATITEYTGSQSTIEIPSSINGYPVAVIGKSAFSGNSGITSVTIPKSVSQISKSAFANCSRLSSVTLNEGLTSIEYEAFANCIRLTAITIPSTVQELGDDHWTYSGPFQGCSMLKTVTFKGTVNSKEAYIGNNSFKGCTSLTSVVIPGNYTDIYSSAFSGCTALASMTYQSGPYDYANQAIHENAFSTCTALKTVKLNSVKSIDKNAFNGCTLLNSLTLNEGLVTVGYGAFTDCIRLTAVTIPSTVQELGDDHWTYSGPFQGCSMLKTVTFKGTVNSEEAYIGNNSFKGCTSLTSVVIPGNYTDIYSSAFSGCTALTSMTYQSGPYSYANQAIHEKAFSTCTALKTVKLNSVNSIDKNAFNGCTLLNSLTLNEGLVTVGYGAFADCSHLTGLTIPSTVQKLGDDYWAYSGPFQGCSMLKTVTFKGTVDSGEAYIGNNSFKGCTSLTSVVIPGNYTDIYSSAFSGCTALTSMTYQAGPYSYANQIIHEKAFSTCTALKTVKLNSVKSIDNDAFNGCSLLKSLTLNEGLEIISRGAFYNCDSLIAVTIPSTVKGIGDTYWAYEGPFDNCDKLASVTFRINKEGNDGFYIGNNSFRDCPSLVYVYIPKTFTTICDSAFKGHNDYLVIWGVSASAAETYAKSHDIPFNKGVSTPQLSSVSNISNGVQIKWKAVTGAAGYRILRRTGSGEWSVLGNSTSSSYLDTTAQAGKTYSYTVRAYRGTRKLADLNYNKSIWSAYNTAGKKIVRLSNPTVTVANASSGITVKWSAVTGAKGYYIYRKSQTAGTERIGEITGTNTRVYTDQAVKAKNGVTYTYTVRAYNGSSLSSCNGKSIVRLSNPTVTLVNTGSGITVKWSKITGAKGYYIYRKSGTADAVNIAKITDSNTCAYTDQVVKAKNGVTYTYTVRAYSGSYLSSCSGKSIVRLSNPTVTVVNAASGITVKWSKITGAKGYYIYRKSGSGDYKKIAGPVGASVFSYSDTGVKNSNGTTYTYMVKAYNGSSFSSGTGKSLVRLVAPAISSISSGSRKMTVKWSKNTSATGYQIFYKVDSVLKTVTVTGNSVVSKSITGLTAGKTYTVYVRSYRTVNGTKYYSAWSASKKIKISK